MTKKKDNEQMDDFTERINATVKLFKESKRISAFTGAGISTESGLSDFRSPGGVWDRFRIVTFQEFLSDHEARVEYWKMKKELFNEMKDAQPNKAHVALAELEKMGKLSCLVTQNIDGLHQHAGNLKVTELHGTNREAVCLTCKNTWPIEIVQARLEAGEEDPRCQNCNGLIKPATISFGQAMPEDVMLRAYECATSCDLFLMVGSSLQVEPAASIPREAYRNGANLIFINRTETHWDNLAALLFRENAGDVLATLLSAIKH